MYKIRVSLLIFFGFFIFVAFGNTNENAISASILTKLTVAFSVCNEVNIGLFIDEQEIDIESIGVSNQQLSYWSNTRKCPMDGYDEYSSTQVTTALDHRIFAEPVLPLDESGEHTSINRQSTEGFYHYHIPYELYLNKYNILFPKYYQGTADAMY